VGQWNAIDSAAISYSPARRFPLIFGEIVKDPNGTTTTIRGFRDDGKRQPDEWSIRPADRQESTANDFASPACPATARVWQSATASFMVLIEPFV
jgi:hypothetical protein